ncbi:MAG: hypothetical protein JSV58_03865 [Candidatus Bathyarchaeota archaeon]|nr:MAG: hypothetical protein JSV58_03865 [Candidatus Bathyarchaeota archaeon]
MIKQLSSFSKYVGITGFKDARITDVETLLSQARRRMKKTQIQFFNAKLIAGWEHLYFAALNALSVFKSKLNISNSLAVETLLYASSQRQINKAVEMLGITRESSEIAVLVITDTKQGADEALKAVVQLISGDQDEGVLDLTAEKDEGIKELFDISDLELEAASKEKGLLSLVIEHMALLVTQR